MDILFSSPAESLQSDSVILAGLYEDSKLFGRISILDQQGSSVISNAIDTNHFSGKTGQTLFLYVNQGIEGYDNLKTVILFGLGKQEDFTSLLAEEVGTQLFSLMKSHKVPEASVLLEGTKDEHIISISLGIKIRDYSFDKYKEKKEDSFEVQKVKFCTENSDYVSALFDKKIKPIAEALKLTRNLVNEPGNILNPETYANIVKELPKSYPNLKVEIIDEKAMQKLGMNALLGVGQGSQHPCKLAIIKYQGNPDKEANPIVLVGKGVTFDTGGVSLKIPRGMWAMTRDMAGSAAVLGTLVAVAGQDLKENVVGILGIVENAVSGNAQRPGDIVISASGKSIEVLNTDAEGRLVLADALWYGQEFFSPKCIIDVATLTGAIVIALGKEYAGLFSNDDQLAKQLTSAGNTVGEKVWKMPLAKNYNKLMDSDVADMKNISTKPYGADSIAAAQFLQRFIKDGVSWAHLDIAGVADDNENCNFSPKGATGFGVRLLTDFIANYKR